jgi:hypothetical protein
VFAEKLAWMRYLSHRSRELDPSNMVSNPELVTEATSQPLMSVWKLAAPWNMPAMVLTKEVLQPPISASNAAAW